VAFTDTKKRRALTEGQVTFAGDEARALLAGRLEELCDPAGAGWERVKHNSSRTIYRGVIECREVYLKRYHSRAIVHRLARSLGISDAKCEMRFCEYLSSRGIETPTALAATCTDGVEWLAMLAVTPSQRASEWHVENLSRGRDGRKRIRKAVILLAEAVAHMHAVGVVHHDLHAGNILIRTDTPEPRPVLMDLHRMKKRPWLSRRDKAMNLAQLLHDRGNLTTRTERLLFLKHYLASSKCRGTLRGWGTIIEEFARSHRRRIYAQRDRRILGNNRYFHRIRLPGLWRGHVVLASKRRMLGSKAAGMVFKLEDWQRALDRPQRLLTAQITKLVKDSASGRIVRRPLRVGDRTIDVFVKRPRRKRPWKILLDCFRSARPIRAFRTGHALLTRQIPTALPLAALQRRIGPLLVDSILITEAHDAQQLDHFLNKWLASGDDGRTGLTSGQRRRLAQQVLGQMGYLLQKLHDNNFRHRDLKSGNMLVQWSPGRRPEIFLVDLDGLRHVAWLTMRQRYQGLMRLNVSLLRCRAVNHAGQLRMLLGYLRRTGGRRVDFKPYWRMLEAWSAKKLREQIHSRRQKQKAVRR